MHRNRSSSQRLTATAARLDSLLVDFSERSGIHHAVTVAAAGLVFVAMVGWINFNLTHGLNLEFVYLLGCALVGWAGGARAALVCVLVSALLLYLDETHGEDAVALGWIYFLNSFVRLAAFASIGWLAAQAGRLTRALEATAEQRTARLQSEVEKHKETAGLLREALELFKQVTGNITEVFWVTDAAKSRVDYVSPEFEKVWGEACETLYRLPGTWLEGVHHADRERVTRATLMKQVTGEYDEEYRVVRPDGSVRWVHDRAFPVKNEAGAVYRVVGVARDITERKDTERLLQAQRDMGVALSSTSNLSFALDRLLEIAAQLEGIDCGGVYLMDPNRDELHLEAHRGLSRSFINRVAHYRADATETRLVKAGQIVYVRGEQIPRSLEVLWGSEGLQALVVVPLQHKSTVLGMLTLGSYRQPEILPKTRAAIEMTASQAAGAIARIRAEESLRRSEANLRAIIHNAPVALIAGDCNGLITFEDGHALEALGIQSGANVGRPAAEAYREFPPVADHARRALAGEEFSTVLELGPSVLECHYTPTRDETAAITGFLGVATNVTERYRLERQILEIGDRQQARIGQDIHDGLCQQLVGLAFDANSLEQSLAARLQPEAAIARRIAALLDEAITESRRVSRGLYPVRLEAEGLVPALNELADSVSERFQLLCRCESNLPEPVCGEVTAIHLYRIAQEAVNNALKHSGAANVSIELTGIPDGIELTVRDDGRGIRAGPKPHSGMGLHTMDYRARSMGGSLRVSRDAGGGTIVSCRVPRRRELIPA